MNSNSKDVSSREELRERIILEALEAFRMHGIKAITMDDIANSLKISKRTLYEIFADKESLLRESMIYHQYRSRKALKEMVEHSDNVLEVILKCFRGSIEAYQSANAKFFEDIKKYPKVHALAKDSREADNTIVVNFMKQGVEQKLFRDDVNFDILLMLVGEQMKLLMNTEISDKYTFIEIYESMMLIYIRGICTPGGIEKLDEFIKEYRNK